MKYQTLKNKFLVNPNRKISRSEMAGIKLIKPKALISIRVPKETLPTKGKININNNTSCRH